MKILALEFSSAQRGAALFDTDTGRLLATASEAGGREMKALGLVQRVLQTSHYERADIGCIALGLGPGSYTGIRASISLAQGWQLALGTRLLGISSVDVLARVAQLQGMRGTIHLIIDAQRNEFYTAQYQISEEAILEKDALKLVPMAHVQDIAQTGAALAGPEAGAVGGKTLFPEAGALARLASGRNDFIAGERLEPIYLRETSFVKAPPTRPLPD